MQKLHYQPKGYWVGDIMPFGKDGTFYLYDQRDNRNPCPFGEPFGWSLATTTDFVNYQNLGDSIKKGGEQDVDQFIYAGCVFEAEGKGHAFYTGYNRNWEKEGKTSQVLLHAWSDDFKTWHKSSELITLTPQAGYDISDWRDPWVIWNDEKQEYLLILGARLKGPKTEQSGRVVAFTSKDLKNWQFQGDFWVAGKYTMIEMPDLFKIGDWWYLIYTEYSDQSKTRYVMSQSLEGPWITPADDAFDGRAYYAARTAFDGKRRILFGWVPTKEDNDDLKNFQWAGTFVPHEVYQRPDHTLGVKVVDSLWNCFTNPQKIDDFSINSPFARQEQLLIENTDQTFRFSTTVKFSKGTRDFSIRLMKDKQTGESYDFIFSLVDNRLTFDKTPCYPWYRVMNKGLERPIHLEADREYNIQIIADDTLLTLYIDGTALNVRGYDQLGSGLAIAVSDGTLSCKNNTFSNEGCFPEKW